jgi:hypothetical protein
MKYVILTSKPGQFRTELDDNLRQVEAYDYVAHGRNRARFVIAEVIKVGKIRIVEEGAPSVVNAVPSKFFPKFDSLEKARHELDQLAHSGSGKTSLVRV